MCVVNVCLQLCQHVGSMLVEAVIKDKGKPLEWAAPWVESRVSSAETVDGSPHPRDGVLQIQPRDSCRLGKHLGYLSRAHSPQLSCLRRRSVALPCLVASSPILDCHLLWQGQVIFQFSLSLFRSPLLSARKKMSNSIILLSQRKEGVSDIVLCSDIRRWAESL